MHCFTFQSVSSLNCPVYCASLRKNLKCKGERNNLKTEAKLLNNFV